MNYKLFSKPYDVRLLTYKDIDDIHQLCLSNPQYYNCCPPNVTIESIKADMVALPKGKQLCDKYYIGYYLNDNLIALMDFIKDYPDNDTCLIGFFMVDAKYQRQYIGTNIIKELIIYLKQQHYQKLRLGYIENNIIAQAFWTSLGFLPIKERKNNIIVLNNYLNIRKMRKSDFSRIAEIFVFNNRLNYYPIFQDPLFSFKKLTVTNLEKTFLNKEFIKKTYVYEDEVLKGFITIKDNEINKLYIDSFFQHQHIGSILLEYAITEHNCDTLWVLKKNNNAVNFYKHHGFIFTQDTKYEKGTTELLCRMQKVSIIPYQQRYQKELINMIKKAHLAININSNFDNLLDLSTQSLYLALLNDKVVGCLGYNTKDNNEVYLHHFYVHPFYKHQGIGSILINYVEKQIKKDNYVLIKAELNTPKHECIEGYRFFIKHDYNFYEETKVKKEI